MMQEYYIIGGGGFAKEVYYLSKEVFKNEKRFKGFIDQKPKEKWKPIGKRKEAVLDEEDFLENVYPAKNVQLFFGIGDPRLIAKLSLKFRNYNFPNLIHPNFIGDRGSIDLGKGNIITAGCAFTVDIKIGSFNIFNLNCTVGHDVIIGDCNVFNPSCNVSGEVKIGSRNLFGVNSTILQQLTILNDNIIGSSSLANREISNENVVVGVPAKKLKK